jgi:DoxX-like family
MQARMSNPAMSGPDAAPFSRRRLLAYWVISAPLLLETMVGAGWDLARTPYVQGVMVHLGYPLYFLTIIGVAKGLAVAALLVPRFPRLKEWAYAGLLFVYVGAACSHVEVGDAAAASVTPLLFAVLTLAAWALRPPARCDPAPNPDVWMRARP